MSSSQYCFLFMFLTNMLLASSAEVRILLLQKPTFQMACTGTFQVQGLNQRSSKIKGHYLPLSEVRLGVDRTIIFDDIKQSYSKGFILQPKEDASFVVEGGRYRGALEVRVTPEGTSMEVINILPMEDYLRGVVGKEVSFYWPFEVLKTQAIVARTYSYDRQIKKKFLLYDLKGTVDSQVYGGVSAETGLIDRAVKETENQVLKYQGRIFPTFYHSSCGGETEASHNIWAIELKPLNGRVCIYCKYSPFQKWKVRYTDQQVSRALKNFPRAQSSKVKEIRVKSRSGSKRVTWMEIVYANKQSIKMSGNTFRLKVGADQLRSTIFDVKKRGSYFYFEGRGWGHGIGLCQWGSKGMVDQKGMTAEEILLHYYPGSELLHV